MKVELFSQLLRFLQESESKHADFLQPVVIGNECVPKFLLIFAGELHPRKKPYFNKIMKHWTFDGDALCKVGELKEYECPFLKSPTFVTCIKSIIF